MAVKLIIDSACDIDKKEAEKLGLILVPMEIRIGDEDFLDGVNITKEEFFDKLVNENDFPQTSQINAYRFEEEVKKIIANGDQAIIITISSKLSGTFENAKLVAAKYPKQVFAIDSLNASLGERILVQYAIRLIKQELSAEEIAKRLDIEKKKIIVLAIVDTLKYLKKGGRISAVVAVAGGMLSIKPLVSIVEGEIKLVGKAVGNKKANGQLSALIATTKGIDFDKPYCHAWSGNDKTKLEDYASSNASIWGETPPTFMIGSTIGTHIGPGAVGVAFFEKE